MALSGFNNYIPKNEEKVLDCSDQSDPSSSSSVCELTLVVAPLLSMTYYENNTNLVGYRAKYSNGILDFLNFRNNGMDKSLLKKPITLDGEFRPILTINGQMPGPTIIAEKDQWLYITVYNELPNGEGISIHWHGMHQSYTSNMDGVAHITQPPILSYQSYTYKFRASPAGTHWYHAHSGAHRTDGLYGALIVKDVYPGGLYNYDLPEQHTLLLMDWQKEPSIDLFYQIRSSTNFFKQNYYCQNNIPMKSNPQIYAEPNTIDGTQVAPIPFWSGIINDKGRHYDGTGSHNGAELSVFNVTYGYRYRFRLIGAQALQAYKFSIQDHLMTVIATDGNHIESIPNAHYVIVNSGERYDIVVNANQPPNNYWILAETLELTGYTFHNPANRHKAEAILHYEGASEPTGFYRYRLGTTWNNGGLHVNCPFFSPLSPTIQPSSPIIYCIYADEFTSLKAYQDNNIYYPVKTLFYNFGFDGEKSTSGSSVDGINFLLPSYLPYTKEYENADLQCPGRGCDHDNTDHCACTQVIDITDVRKGQCIELVITNYPRKDQTMTESSHPVHLHGHSFSVLKIGYPSYNYYYYSQLRGQYMSPNRDITCQVADTGELCERFITVDRLNPGQKIQRIQSVMWSNDQRPEIPNKNFVEKDTVIVPFGGYVVIRFIVDNPGWWFFHCHIEIHQLEGMAAVIKELNPGEVFSTGGTKCNIIHNNTIIIMNNVMLGLRPLLHSLYQVKV